MFEKDIELYNYEKKSLEDLISLLLFNDKPFSLFPDQVVLEARVLTLDIL